MNKLILAALTALSLVACQSTPPKEEGAPVEDRTPSTGAAGATTSGSASSGIAGSATTGQNPLKNPNSILSKRIVYFDFDSYVVKDEYKPLIEAHAKYLQGNRGTRMTIQGNADERGSREYNIALGQRRADAVKKMMMLYGAGEAQIETVSFGKEKPRVEGHDEAAWAQNRRDEIVYVGID